MHSRGSAVSSRKLVWRISCVCTRNTSQEFHSGTKTSVQKIVPYPTTPTKPHGSFEEFSIAKWIPMLQAKYFLKGIWLWAILNNPAAHTTLPGTKKHTTFILPKLRTHQIKGLPFFHCSSISAASKGNLCRDKRDWHFFYNKANCLSLPHSIKCLLFHFATEQEVEGQRGPIAEQRTCHLTIHLRPRFQWETTAFLFFFSPFLQETDTR